MENPYNPNGTGSLRYRHVGWENAKHGISKCPYRYPEHQAAWAEGHARYHEDKRREAGALEPNNGRFITGLICGVIVMAAFLYGGGGHMVTYKLVTWHNGREGQGVRSETIARDKADGYRLFRKACDSDAITEVFLFRDGRKVASKAWANE